MKTKFLKNLAVAFMCLAFSAVSFSASAESADQSRGAEKVLYQDTFHFGYGFGQWIDVSDYTRADELVKWAQNNSEGIIDIKGWASSEGDKVASESLAFKRARTIHNFLVQNGIDSSRIVFKGMGIDTTSTPEKARRAEVIVRVADAKPAPAPKPQPQKPAEKPAEKPQTGAPHGNKPAPAGAPQAEKPATPSAPKAEAEAKAKAAEAEAKVEEATSSAAATTAATAATAAAATAAAATVYDPCKFSLRTNLAYWPVGLMNIGAEWQPANTRLGIVLNAGYSPFSSDDWQFNLGGWFVSPEVRYYIGSKEQWFVGVQYLAGGYDLKIWDEISALGREGTVSAIGLMGGYKFKLSDSFDMDLTLGLGYASAKYDTYHTDDSGRTPYEYGCNFKRFLPIQGGINLIWNL